MKSVLLQTVGCVFGFLILFCNGSYISDRQQVLIEDGSQLLGHDILLSKEENLVNNLMMKLKSDIYNLQPSLLSKNFLYTHANITNTSLFSIITKMPKGAALHLHSSPIMDLEWMITNITYRENLYICYGPNRQVFLVFSLTYPSEFIKPNCTWKLLATERQQSGNITLFDTWLHNNLTLTADDALEAGDDQNEIWRRFSLKFGSIAGLTSCSETFDEVWTRTLEYWAEKDNVQYLEIRASFNAKLYSWSGNNDKTGSFLERFEKVNLMYANKNPYFMPSRLILNTNRHTTENDIQIAVTETIKLANAYPKTVVGFDLVGQEDLGFPLLQFVKQLTDAKPKLKYFFHAGETDWMNTEVDENLIDAVILNTSRIGHGYALLKHPAVLKQIKLRNVAVEINAISNQVLGLVADMRNHPASVLLTNDYPLVISSDDPSFWFAQGLSHDFFVAFVVLGGKNGDLKMIKQLILNSIKYSSLDKKDQTKLLNIWLLKWKQFIHETITKFKL